MIFFLLDSSELGEDSHAIIDCSDQRWGLFRLFEVLASNHPGYVNLAATATSGRFRRILADSGRFWPILADSGRFFETNFNIVTATVVFSM